MDNQVVLVTGCSTGIGRAIVNLLSGTGYSVVATARDPGSLAGIDAVQVLRLDVTDDGSISEAVEAVLDRFGRIDVLVNNAGFAIRGAVEDLDIDAVRRIFDVNVNGIIRMTKAAAPSMRARGSGRIINIGSVVGKLSIPVNGAYSATKHAVEALSDAMRLELGCFGIDVVLIEPGNIRTNFMETSLKGSNSVLGNPASPYAGIYSGFTAATSALRSREPGPEAVARVVLKALGARRPHARYHAAVPFATRFMTALPDSLRDPLMRLVYGLKKT